MRVNATYSPQNYSYSIMSPQGGSQSQGDVYNTHVKPTAAGKESTADLSLLIPHPTFTAATLMTTRLYLTALNVSLYSDPYDNKIIPHCFKCEFV